MGLTKYKIPLVSPRPKQKQSNRKIPQFKTFFTNKTFQFSNPQQSVPIEDIQNLSTEQAATTPRITFPILSHTPQIFRPFGPKTKSIAVPFKQLGNAQPPIILQNYIVEKLIGKGAYASVRLALNKTTKQKVAIKFYPKKELQSISRKQGVVREIKILSKLDHPNIMKLFQQFQTQQFTGLVLEHIKGVQLSTYIRKRPMKRLMQRRAKLIFFSVVQALDYCHSRNVTHRDIKLQNIIVNQQGDVKLIDFGFATCFPHTKKIKMFCGTPSYMAPQIVARQISSGPPTDIWAAGVLLYYILCGDFPFKAQSDTDLYSKIQQGNFNIPDYVDQNGQILLSKMLTTDPETRITAREILKDSWFFNRAQQLKMSSITSVLVIQKSEVRSWLRKHGKREYIGFDDQQRSKLKKYFSSLDESNRGSIGYRELEEPLIALGLAQNRQEVEEMVKSVDFDESGNIEFEEFLTILQGSRGNAKMSRFFKGLIEGTLIKDSKTLPFKLVVSSYRRKMIIDALMASEPEKKEMGQKVMRAFARQLQHNKKTRASTADVFPADLRIGFPKLPRIIDDSVFSSEKVKDILKLKKMNI